MESVLHLVMNTSYATFEVTFKVSGDTVLYTGSADGQVVTSTTMDRTEAMVKWNALLAKGYREPRA